jgi:Amt family ammonium transporter
MAERTKFSAYCVYSAIVSLVIYPIEAGWVWNSQGWLAQLGYIDFAGSSAIHMVGGIMAFIGAAFLGPRIGKYVKDAKSGKTITKAIPGHSITLGALGVFILWFGWYGFNGAAAGDVTQLGSIFVNTTIAPAVATCVTMAITWIKNGKPDVSMSLNGSLAGLVGITAGCANLDAIGSFFVGLVSGVLVVVAVEVIDQKIKVDDPVGAVAVHGVNGIWGTLAVGLFALPSDGFAGGLFYGGGFEQLGIQTLGIVAIAAWTVVMITLTFLCIRKTIGVRVTPEEEVTGLDIHEHGMVGYADFMPMSGIAIDSAGDEPVPVGAAVPVVKKSTNPDAKLTKVSIVTNQTKFEKLRLALDKLGITGLTVTQVLGYGIQKGHPEYYRGAIVDTKLLPKVKVEVVISKISTEDLIATAKKALYTGNVGDGKIFVYDVENVVKVRTGEEGYDALQDVE